jgi:hypothetical protein
MTDTIKQGNLDGAQVKRNWLMYHGKDYPNFLREAKMIGVSRNIPLKQLANLTWGDEILIGTFHTYGRHEDSTDTKKDGSKRWPNGKPVNLGEARIECGFAVRELMVRQPRVSKALADKIIAECALDEVIPAQGRIVWRACGSYILGTQYVMGHDITTTIKHLYELLLEVKKELKLNVVKVMIGGPVTHILPPGSGFFDAKFTRGVVEIETTGIDFGKEFESEHDSRNKVIRIHKYEPVKKGRYCTHVETDAEPEEA